MILEPVSLGEEKTIQWMKLAEVRSSIFPFFGLKLCLFEKEKNWYWSIENSLNPQVSHNMFAYLTRLERCGLFPSQRC